jgi:putative hydrolase of the HAD superfamily
MKGPKVSCLFLDIGGVLLSDGWDHHARKRAATKFKLDWPEMEQRHRLNFSTFEEGRLTLREYLERVVFYQKRPFSRAQFRRFMFSQSTPHPGDDRAGQSPQTPLRAQSGGGQQ